MPASLPPDVEQVFKSVLACELSTLSKNGGPVTWPLAYAWKREDYEFVLSTGVAYPRKIENIRRDDRVSLLFSEFTGSGLSGAPAVLVQGRADVPGDIRVAKGLEDFWEELFRKQPDSLYGVLDSTTREMTPPGYYWRVRITVKPERIWVFRQDEMGQQAVERVA